MTLLSLPPEEAVIKACGIVFFLASPFIAWVGMHADEKYRKETARMNRARRISRIQELIKKQRTEALPVTTTAMSTAVAKVTEDASPLAICDVSKRQTCLRAALAPLLARRGHSDIHVDITPPRISENSSIKPILVEDTPVIVDSVVLYNPSPFNSSPPSPVFLPTCRGPWLSDVFTPIPSSGLGSLEEMEHVPRIRPSSQSSSFEVIDLVKPRFKLRDAYGFAREEWEGQLLPPRAFNNTQSSENGCRACDPHIDDEVLVEALADMPDLLNEKT